MFLWGFGSRIHPSDLPVRLIRRLLDDCPNIAVIRAEGGFPSIMSIVECHRHFGEEAVISCPIGPVIPRVMRLLREGRFDEVTQTYWQLHPARKVTQGLAAQLHGGAFINRQAWKFQGWLQGYNGGPLRQPTQRIHDAQMHALRKGLVDAGLEPSTDPLRDFLVGRYPG
ncbi:hypothetical protein [Nocardioides flavescens]|uniref:hypothetical protein n=1 Tax=Nocardioides flavescens TaxID=2691959 RepID=UPI001F474E00|nr:hypothetical protein [Nocardioides flavescens]